MYPDSFVNELKNTIPISSLIGRFIPLKRTGGRVYKACCPFHAEKTPSFNVNDDMGIYKCFGCGKGGDIFSFVMEHEHLNFKETIEYIANSYNVPLPKIEKERKKEEVDEIELLLKINEDDCVFFESTIIKNTDGIIYAKKRGLTLENIKKFRIGYAPNDYHVFLNHMKDKGYEEQDLLKSGVVIEKNDKKKYDKFRNRLMFPILNKSGKVIAFQGRTLENDGIPKYLNSPETKIFTKGNTLFNYYFARKSIYDGGYGILVEGNMDAISLAINGIENVVAPMGTGITKEQITELWRTTDKIIVCFDGDGAGQKAMVRLSKMVLPIIKTNKEINFAFLSNEKDPDDFVRKNGKDAFLNLLKNSIPISEFIWMNETKNLELKIPENRAIVEDKLTKITDLIEDLKLKNEIKREYKDKMWDFILEKRKNKQPKHKTTDIMARSGSVDIVEMYEKQICEKVAKFPSLIEKCGLNIDSFTNGRCAEIFDNIENRIILIQEQKEYLQIKDDWEEEKSGDYIFICQMEIEKINLKNDGKNEKNIEKKIMLDKEIRKIDKKIEKLKLKNNLV
ncbi:MAG: DNA primase [Rickettsiales bacterium]|jgi:DNA primase|nr:DNA primase [Rickettsiales bacterium]